MKRNIHILTPGRICLFGDHQDYLELPVIACAISKGISLSSEENETGVFEINLPDINSQRSIPIDATFDTLEPGDFFASALRVVGRYGCQPNLGFNLTFKSTIPINAGTSSSSAMIVSWIHFLLTAFGGNQEISASFIAQLAYEAEVLEHQSPGGKMDQYTIALGHIIYIDTSQHFSYTELGIHLDGMILGVSGIPKKTIGLLGEVRTKAQEAIAQVTGAVPSFRLKEATLDAIASYSNHITASLRPYFYAAIKNHQITQAAKLEFEQKEWNLETIGRFMTEHHRVLKNELKITVPRIDDMIAAALDAGAFGAKMVGSGGGGSIVALAPKHKKEAVIKAILKAGAVEASEVSVAKGTHLIPNHYA